MAETLIPLIDDKAYWQCVEAFASDYKRLEQQEKALRRNPISLDSLTFTI